MKLHSLPGFTADFSVVHLGQNPNFIALVQKLIPDATSAGEVGSWNAQFCRDIVTVAVPNCQYIHVLIL